MKFILILFYLFWLFSILFLMVFFFADDFMENIMCMKAIMRCFELMLGLKVNFYKSSFEGVRMNTFVLHRYASILNCYPMVLSFVYLGIPIEENPRRESVLVPILEKCRKRLSKCRQKTIS